MNKFIECNKLYGISIEKAIKLISEVIDKKNITFEQIKALNLAKSILELHIERKPMYEYNKRDVILCPNCNKNVNWTSEWEYDKDNYCCHCGQHLSWDVLKNDRQ